MTDILSTHHLVQPGHATTNRGAPMVAQTAPDAASATGNQSIAERRSRLLTVVRERGYERRDEPFELASGELSHDFIDGKRALSRGADLSLACGLMASVAEDEGVDFDAVGGLVLGAVQFATGVAMETGKEWFVVRKRRKGRGTDRLVEGAVLAAGTRVLLVDDVVSTGGSIRQAYEAVRGVGAEVVMASTLVDRGGSATRFFGERSVAYHPLLTYRDLGIEPIGDGS